MTDYESANIPLREISDYGSRHATSVLVNHFPKMCVLIAITEFEQPLKDAICEWLKKPNLTVTGNAVQILKAINKKTKRKSMGYCTAAMILNKKTFLQTQTRFI